jgi:hypothetical protein
MLSPSNDPSIRKQTTVSQSHTKLHHYLTEGWRQRLGGGSRPRGSGRLSTRARWSLLKQNNQLVDSLALSFAFNNVLFRLFFFFFVLDCGDWCGDDNCGGKTNHINLALTLLNRGETVSPI